MVFLSPGSQAPAWEPLASGAISRQTSVPKLELGNQGELELGNQGELELGKQGELELGKQGANIGMFNFRDANP